MMSVRRGSILLKNCIRAFCFAFQRKWNQLWYQNLLLIPPPCPSRTNLPVFLVNFQVGFGPGAFLQGSFIASSLLTSIPLDIVVRLLRSVGLVLVVLVFSAVPSQEDRCDIVPSYRS